MDLDGYRARDARLTVQAPAMLALLREVSRTLHPSEPLWFEVRKFLATLDGAEAPRG